jgi:hypothetical protein
MALLYRVVEVEGRRMLWDIVRELMRRGVSEIEIVVSLVPQLECVKQAGRELECRARPSAREAYFKCRDLVKPERQRQLEGLQPPPPLF